MTREELIDKYAMDRETHLSFAEYCYEKGRSDAEHDYNAKLISLINNAELIEKHGDMIKGIDLAVEFGLMDQIEKEFNR